VDAVSDKISATKISNSTLGEEIQTDKVNKQVPTEGIKTVEAEEDTENDVDEESEEENGEDEINEDRARYGNIKVKGDSGETDDEFDEPEHRLLLCK